MKRIYLLAYITILCCLCPLLKAQLGPMPFTPVPPNDPSLVRLLNSDVRCRQWVDSVMQRLTLKERIGQLFIYTIAPQQDKANPYQKAHILAKSHLQPRSTRARVCFSLNNCGMPADDWLH